MRNSGKVLLGLVLQQEGALPEGRQAGPLNGVRVGVGSWVGSEGWLGWCSPPLVVLCAGTMHNTLIFALDTSDVAAGFLAFLYLFS